MKDFSTLYADLDASASIAVKLQALKSYLARTDAADAAWAVYVLAGGKPRRLVRTALIKELAAEQAGLPAWLFEASYQSVGDLAETIAHLLPESGQPDDLSLAAWMEQRLLALRDLDEAAQRSEILVQWRSLDRRGVFLWVKLVGGGFRVGVSRQLVQRALAEHAGLPLGVVAQRMMGYTDAGRRPDAQAYAALTAVDAPQVQDGRPYPFFLAQSYTDEDLGPVSDWQVEWKYDGVRAQLVRRGEGVWLWSRGEELLNEAFPDVLGAAHDLPPGTVLDGELLVWRDDRPAPFSDLQKRLGRKRPSASFLERLPVVFLAYDLLEEQGCDLRSLSLRERRARLQVLLQGRAIAASALLSEPSWDELNGRRQQAREQGVEGLMLKHLDSRYGIGRTRSQGLWFKWKSQPMVIDGVLIYAQAGHGRRALLYSDYTFGVWNRPPASAKEAQAVVEAIARRQPLPVQQEDRPLVEQPLHLVAFAKAYSGLSDVQMRQVDAIVSRSIVDKFGPVRSVRPSLVFELAFEGIMHSGRHKSGVALRFPRISRLRSDKPLHEASTLADLQALLRATSSI
jgi:DNA ligase-1